jgi:hypothetical protein
VTTTVLNANPVNGFEVSSKVIMYTKEKRLGSKQKMQMIMKENKPCGSIPTIVF